MRCQSILIAGAALLAAACASSGPVVRTEANPDLQFGQYRSYGYVSPLGTDRSGYSTILTQRLKNAVGREMQSRGYEETNSDPDLLINFYVNVEDKQKVTTTPRTGLSVGYGYYGYRYGIYSSLPIGETRSYEYKEGTLSIDLVDAEQMQLAWSGVIEGRVTEEALNHPEQTVDSAVAAIFERFPYRAAQ